MQKAGAKRTMRPASRARLLVNFAVKRPLADVQWTQEAHALKLYELDVMARVEIVKSGIPAFYVETLSASMGLAKEKLYQTMGLARPTLDRKIRKRSRLNKDESESVLGIARLVGQAQSVVNESGNRDGFDAAKWTASWLAQPLPALGGKRPAELMDTAGWSCVSLKAPRSAAIQRLRLKYGRTLLANRR